MNQLLLTFITIFAFFSTLIAYSCPTCVAKVKPESPAFFSEEFYQPGQAPSRLTSKQYGQQELQKLFKEQKGKK